MSPTAECLFGFRCVALLYFHIAMQQDAGMPIRITICWSEWHNKIWI